MSAVYDSGALMAAERGDRRMLTLHQRLLDRGHRPLVTAGVLAQVWRGGGSYAVNVLLRGCLVEPMNERDARKIGDLLGEARTSDIVDAAVVLRALPGSLPVVTSDRGDLAHLARSLGQRLAIIDV